MMRIAMIQLTRSIVGVAFLCLVPGLGLVSCSQDHGRPSDPTELEQGPFAGIAKSEETIEMPMVQIHYVLFLDDTVEDVETLFRRACGDRIKILTTIAEGRKTAGVLLEQQSTAERPVPDQQVLSWFGRGFTPESAARLANTKAAISFTGLGPFDPRHELLRELTKCVGRLAKEQEGFVFDGADWMTFTPAAFHQLRVAEIEAGQLSPAQFGVRAYRIDVGLRSVSMGLEKFGQPNLAITHFSEHQMGAIDQLMTLAMQTVIEAPERIRAGPLTLDVEGLQNSEVKRELWGPTRPGATGQITVELRSAAPLEGDPKELLAPEFRAEPGPKLWEEQGRVLASLFGRDRDVSDYEPNRLIQQAIDKAREAAAAILDDPNQWKMEGRRMRVAVELPDSQEVVWLEVRTWRDGKGTGLLLSDPLHVKNLRSGANVAFTKDMLMDYTLSDPEGVLESGGVDRLVRQLKSGG